MKIRSSLAFILLPVLVLLLGLSGCGGSGSTEADSETDDTANTGTTSGTGATVGTAHTIAITWPNTNAIEDLGGGVYRRLVSAIVTDKDGNAVPDGTLVSLNVIDSILASGMITTTVAGDSIAGSVLTDMGGGSSFFGYGVGFDSAHIYRNAAIRYITSGDQVLLINADEEDKARVASSAALTNNTITTTEAYIGTYPNATYETDGFPASYVVGASLLGIEVSSAAAEDSEGTGSKRATGVASTEEGIATFHITYPANVDTILSGCPGMPAIDTRSSPVGSADVYLVASVNSAVTAVSDEFCFRAIAGGTITTNPSTITGAGVEPVTLVLRDGGDGVRLPFSDITTELEVSGTLDVDLANEYTTNAIGEAVATITVTGGASGDSATITFTGNQFGSTAATGSVEITIP